MYNPKITMTKAIWQGAGTAALFAVALAASDMPTDWESIKALWPSIVAGAVAAGVKAAANFVKHNMGRDQ